MIRIITHSDLETLLPLIRTAYPNADRIEQVAEQILSDPNPFQALIGDPSVPIMARLAHYQMPPDFPVVAARGRMCTQICDLYPMSVEAAVTVGIVREEDVTPATGLQLLDTYVAPLLAEGLGRIAEAFPVIAGRPVWAQLPNALVNVMKNRYFPGSGTQGRYIWHVRLSDAAAAIASYRP